MSNASANMTLALTTASGSSPLSTLSSSASDPRTTSVAELRRKAQEHSAALLQSLQAAAAAGFSFPAFNIPPLALQSALNNSRKAMANDFSIATSFSGNHNENTTESNNDNNNNHCNSSSSSSVGEQTIPSVTSNAEKVL